MAFQPRVGLSSGVCRQCNELPTKEGVCNCDTRNCVACKSMLASIKNAPSAERANDLKESLVGHVSVSHNREYLNAMANLKRIAVEDIGACAGCGQSTMTNSSPTELEDGSYCKDCYANDDPSEEGLG